MDTVDMQKKLNKLTEIAIENRDVESLKLIRNAIKNPPDLAPNNYGEFFYCMVPADLLEAMDARR